MAHIIVDRRKNDKNKSSMNRQKFIERVRDFVKDSVKDLIRNTSVKSLSTNTKKKIKIPVRNLDEPSFRHDPDTGINRRVVPGNKKFVPGDKIDRPQGGDGQGGGGSPDGEGEDDFVFQLTKEEFLDIFFENLELPNIIRKDLAVINHEEFKRAGYINDGSPSMLNIVRSMRVAKSRKFGLTATKQKKIQALQEERDSLEKIIVVKQQSQEDCSEQLQRIEEIDKEIETLRARIKKIPFIDPVDLRYTNWAKVPQPAVQAVMFCVMDVSGSMDQRKKELAKSFFLLLYLFLQRNYERVEIVFVRHHTTAKEVDEEQFFYSPESGGTVVSTALELVDKIIDERYPLSMWNIYVAQASDGDNWRDDNVIVKDIIEQRLLHKIQYLAYVQIEPEGHSGTSLSFYYGGGSNNDDSLWKVYSDLADVHSNLDVALVRSEKQVYTALEKLFERKKQHEQI